MKNALDRINSQWDTWGENISDSKNIRHIIIEAILHKAHREKKYWKRKKKKLSVWGEDTALKIQETWRTSNKINSRNHAQKLHNQTAARKKNDTSYREEQQLEWLHIFHQKPWKPEENGTTSLRSWKNITVNPKFHQKYPSGIKAK